MEQLSRLVLGPARVPSIAWAAAGVVLLASGVWLVLDSEGAPLSWVAVSVFGAAAAYFLLQVLAPSLFTVVCDDHGLRARTPWRTLDVGWDQIDLASVERFAGDPLLRLHVRTPAPEVVDLLLPVGADVWALHDFLRQRLGPAPGPPSRGVHHHDEPAAR